jgi:hypothetical protein
MTMATTQIATQAEIELNGLRGFGEKLPTEMLAQNMFEAIHNHHPRSPDVSPVRRLMISSNPALPIGLCKQASKSDAKIFRFGREKHDRDGPNCRLVLRAPRLAITRETRHDHVQQDRVENRYHSLSAGWPQA